MLVLSGGAVVTMVGMGMLKQYLEQRRLVKLGVLKSADEIVKNALQS